MKRKIAFLAAAIAATVGLGSCSSPTQNTNAIENNATAPINKKSTPIESLSGNTTKKPNTTTRAS